MFKFRSKLIVAVIIILGVTAFLSCEKEEGVVEGSNKFSRLESKAKFQGGIESLLVHLKETGRLSYGTKMLGFSYLIPEKQNETTYKYRLRQNSININGIDIEGGEKSVLIDYYNDAYTIAFVSSKVKLVVENEDKYFTIEEQNIDYEDALNESYSTETKLEFYQLIALFNELTNFEITRILERSPAAKETYYFLGVNIRRSKAVEESRMYARAWAAIYDCTVSETDVYCEFGDFGCFALTSIDC